MALLPDMVKDIHSAIGGMPKGVRRQYSLFSDIGESLRPSHALPPGQYSTGYNLFVLVAERTVATVLVDRYEDLCPSIPWLALLLSAAQVMEGGEGGGIVIAGDIPPIPIIASIAIGCAVAATVSGRPSPLSSLLSQLFALLSQLFALLPRSSVYTRQLQEKKGSITRYQFIEILRSASLSSPSFTLSIQVLHRLVLSDIVLILTLVTTYSSIRFGAPSYLSPLLYNIHYSIIALGVSSLLRGNGERDQLSNSETEISASHRIEEVPFRQGHSMD